MEVLLSVVALDHPVEQSLESPFLNLFVFLIVMKLHEGL